MKNKRGPKVKKIKDPNAPPKKFRRSPKDPPIDHICPFCSKKFKYISQLEEHKGKPFTVLLFHPTLS